MASYLRWTAKLQSLPPVPHLHNSVLFRVFLGFGDVGMDGDSERGRIQRVVDAGKLCNVGCDIRDHWNCSGWIYGVAYSACFEGPNYD